MRAAGGRGGGGTGAVHVPGGGVGGGSRPGRPLTRVPGRLSGGAAEGLKVQTERTRSMLLFANVSARHYGNYTCRAANRLGASSASMRLLRACERRGRGLGPRGGAEAWWAGSGGVRHRVGGTEAGWAGPATEGRGLGRRGGARAHAGDSRLP